MLSCVFYSLSYGAESLYNGRSKISGLPLPRFSLKPLSPDGFSIRRLLYQTLDLTFTTIHSRRTARGIQSLLHLKKKTTTFSFAVHHLAPPAHHSYLQYQFPALLAFLFFSPDFVINISHCLLFSFFKFFLPQRPMIYSEERVHGALFSEHLHNKHTQTDFNEAAAFPLESALH